jgi:predicted transcriptional regulator
MPETNLPRPTDSELSILNVLWDRGPSTVREVHDELSQTHETGYTTILKLLQIMTDKGLVVRDESNRAHVYTARLSAQRTQRQLLGDLIERAFGGSGAKLVMQALSASKASSEDLSAIRQLIDQMEGDAK